MDANDLENALNNATGDSVSAGEGLTPSQVPSGESKMSGEEELGFHKGALNTLAAERGELVKMVGNVEAIMQAHISRLKELGVDINGK